MRAEARHFPFAPSPALRYCLRRPARSSTRSTSSIRIGWQGASSAWATCSRLIEKTQANYDQKKAKELERKFKKNEFTLTDFAEQMKAIKKMGSLGDLVGMIPGLKKVAGQVDSEESKRELVRIQAIIDSMTIQERENHLILNGKRRARIAGGSGTSVQDVNRFLKQFEQTRKVMKKLTRMGAGRAMMRGMGLG